MATVGKMFLLAHKIRKIATYIPQVLKKFWGAQ
jgi:hypothetical protein